MKHSQYDAVVIGGGVYGCVLALSLAKQFKSVIIIESKDELITKASYVNQARIHNGYHYPRSFLTAIRSHINYARFVVDFKKAIYDDYKQYYAIARHFSKTTSYQFSKFASQIESPIKRVPSEILRLFNPNLIEDVFEVDECVFDAHKLRNIFQHQLSKSNIKVLLNTTVEKVTHNEKYGNILCDTSAGTIEAKHVFNCAYAGINNILKNSELPLISFKYEYIEMPLIEVPPQLSKMSVTVMDGPFFGFLPFPDQDLHSFWHVRYSVHTNWTNDIPSENNLSEFRSKYIYMIKDASRYIPSLEDSVYVKSLFETKTVLVSHEASDGRPILYRKNYGIPNFHIIMGGKIDNIYDVIDEVSNSFE